MDINIRKEEKALVVSVMGRMDAVSAPDFDTRVEEQINKGETDFILDLSGLDYISSAGLRSMLTLAKKLKTKEGDLVLCGLQVQYHPHDLRVGGRGPGGEVGLAFS